MYQLTLTKSERDAINWVGNRYGHGDDLFDVLNGCSVASNQEEIEWEDPHDMTFFLSESDAHRIYEIGRQSEFRWDCFSDELCDKLTNFCFNLV